MATCFICGEQSDRGQFCKAHSGGAFRAIADVVLQELARTKKRQLESSLTWQQWTNALVYFSVGSSDAIEGGVITFGCAYCRCPLFGGQGDGITVDHWLPVSRGGGTTALNCVPTCTDCNEAKMALTGDQFFNQLIKKWKAENAGVHYQYALDYFEAVRRGTLQQVIEINWAIQMKRTGWSWVNEIYP